MINGNNLLESLLKEVSFVVRGQQRMVKGIAKYSTINNPQEEYIKVAFTDDSGIFFPLTDETSIYFFERKLGKVRIITDQVIKHGTPEIVWNGKKFTLINKLDYQYVKQLYIGTIGEIEGEVRFSDYEDAYGNVLSVGWNLHDNKRDDVYAEILQEREYL